MTAPKKTASRRGRRAGERRWPLQDAKARFSEVVREAQERGPQRVTLHGRDAVVIVSAEEFDRLARPITGKDIVAALAQSPLQAVAFDRLTIRPRVRDVDL